MQKNRKTIYRILIGSSLLALWLLLTMWNITSFDKSFLILSYPHGKSAFENFTTKPILEGNKLQGEITSEVDGLGIIMLRFKSAKRVPYKDEDMLVFRIKELGAKDWYYQNNYRSGFIYDLPVLPFGFPIINDSKGKKYVFELESLKGASANAVSLSDRDPVVVSRYHADKQTLLSSPVLLLKFTIEKFLSSIRIVDIYFSSFVFFLPFFLFLLSGSRKINKIQRRFLKHLFGSAYKVRFYLLSLLLITILIDVFYLQILSDLLYPVIAVLWIILLRRYQIENRITLIVGLILILISPIFLRISNIAAAEKSGAWSFTFLAIWWFQIVLSSMKDKNKQESKQKKPSK